MTRSLRRVRALPSAFVSIRLSKREDTYRVARPGRYGSVGGCLHLSGRLVGTCTEILILGSQLRAQLQQEHPTYSRPNPRRLQLASLEPCERSNPNLAIAGKPSWGFGEVARRVYLVMRCFMIILLK